MNDYQITPTKKAALKGVVLTPPSKSHSLRAVLFGALAKGKSIIQNYLKSDDTFRMIEACRLLGAQIIVKENELEIDGIGGEVRHSEDVIHAGNSGIVLRFCAALAGLGTHPFVITGDHSIRHQRPMKHLLDGLNQLGILTRSMRGDGYAPVIIQGPFTTGKVTISGEDSQPVSALLIAASFAKGPTEICVKNPGEKPWIDMTLWWLKKLGLACFHQDYMYYQVKGQGRYPGFRYRVPGDFSSAAFPIAAALVTQSNLKIENIDINDCQGDKKVIEILKKMGAQIRIDEVNQILYIEGADTKLVGITLDVNDVIDAITILAVVACFSEGETVIKNGAVAKQKECNRIHCIAKELGKMEAQISETEDGLIIQHSSLKGASLCSYGDHRMVMSLSVAALGAEGESTISSIQCVSKTFPHFARDFNSIGAKIKEVG